MTELSGQRDKMIGFIAVLISAMLIMGGVMFSLVVWLVPAGKPLPFPVAPAFIQVALGVLGAAAGAFLIRGYSKAKVILGIVALGVVANIGFLIVATFL